MAGRQSKGFNRGLPGTSDFRIDELVAGDLTAWDSTIRKWARTPQADLRLSTLYFSGDAKAVTTADGLTVGDNNDVTPTSGGIGQLVIDGNGYNGFIALNATAMYVGHNSSSQHLAFMVDETVEYQIYATGVHQFNYNGSTHFVMQGTNAYLQSTSDVNPYFALYGNDSIRDMYFQAASDAAYFWYGQNHGAYFILQGEDAGGTARSLIQADPDNYTDLLGAGTLGIRVGATTLGFFGITGVAQPTVTGSRGGNAALASLCTALANLGLITDSTSA